jgi:hypothetical protein
MRARWSWFEAALAASWLAVGACVSGSSVISGGAGGSSGGAGTGGAGSGAGGARAGTGGSGLGGASGSPGGGAGGALANPNPTGLCPADTATCTQVEWNAYTTCIANACDSQYQVCLGAGYRSGTFTGPCGPWAQCLSGCGCGNAGCRAACPDQTADCASCYASVSTCLLSCNIPACAVTAGAPDAGAGGGTDAASGGDAAAGANCAALLACCNAISDPTQKSDCTDSYSMIVSYGDRACGQILDEFMMIGYCP